MSFIVRQIALKASGEEIVRTARVEGDTLTIGRDAACEIHLPDLAVDPRHARVRSSGGNTLTIESIANQPFEVNGRSTVRRELNLAAGAELGFGGYRLTLARDDASGLPEITVRRIEAVSESAEDRDLGTAYTLKGLLPGKRVSAWGFALLVLLSCLAWPVWSYMQFDHAKPRPAQFHGDELWSPGKLSQAHQQLGRDCQACHTQAFVAVRDNACLTCHTSDAHQHIADRPGQTAAQRLTLARGAPEGMAKFQRAVADAFNRPAGRCTDCHTEHEGSGPMPATQQRFCTDCHAAMKERLKDTKLADAGDFGTSHPVLQASLVSGFDGTTQRFTRTALGPAAREEGGLKFTHAQHLSATNGVAQMVRRRVGNFKASGALGCGDCHIADPSGTRFEPVRMETACQSCHSLTFDQIGGTFRTLRHGEPAMVVADLRAFYRSTGPARPASLGGLARRVPGDAARQSDARDYARAVHFYPARADQAIAAVFSPSGACGDCHQITRGGPAASAGFAVQPVAQSSRYFTKGWFTHDRHRQTPCAECHVGVTRSNDAREVLIPGLDGAGGCRTCHVGEGGAHIARVDHPVASTCAMCHDFHAAGGAPWAARKAETRRAPLAGADRRRVPAPAPAPRVAER